MNSVLHLAGFCSDSALHGLPVIQAQAEHKLLRGLIVRMPTLASPQVGPCAHALPLVLPQGHTAVANLQDAEYAASRWEM
jgi:hypothetical protein